MTYSGYNQEDSLIINEGSLHRGFASATIYHTEKDEDKNIHGDEEIRCKADKTKTKGMKFGNYDKLNEKGRYLKIHYWKIEMLLLEKLFLLKKIKMTLQKL